MKFGIGISVNKSNANTKSFNPLAIGTACVGWWDFTDATTMYTDDGSTLVRPGISSPIYRIDNKAYSLQGNDNNAIGKYLEASDLGKRPAYTMLGTERLSYAQFDGTADYLVATKAIGSVDTNKLSDSTLNGRAITVIYVVKSDVSAVSGDMYLMRIQSPVALDNFQLYVDNNSSTDRWEWDTQDDSGGRTHTRVNCGQNITTSTEFWTIRLDSATSCDFYRNGDITDGVTDGASDDMDIDLSADDTDIGIWIGSNVESSGNYYDGGIYEIIIYDSILSDSDLKHINSYLFKKYRLK